MALDYLTAMMTQGATYTRQVPAMVTVECSDGLPADAEILAEYCQIDPVHETVRLLVRHPSFEPTLRGCNFPDWRPGYRVRWDTKRPEEATT